MEVKFSRIDLLDRPVLILENMSFEVIGPLSAYAFDVEFKPMYNEVSTLTFTVPAFVDYQPVPFYSELKGMRVVELVGVGRFILVNPTVNSDGLKETKTCTAYSLEYETTFKQLVLTSGTYNLWNPLKPENTILGMFMEDLPAWKRESYQIEVDTELIDRYRTFEVSDNWYNFLKNTAQKAYQCIFEFDNMERIIRVRAVKNGASTKQVFISLSNLTKNIEVAEDTDSIFTCLEPYGANGLDVRSVNPLGTNKIYNLDYYMNLENFNQDEIDGWNRWKENLKTTKDAYYSKTIERALLNTQVELAKAELVEIDGEITRLENLYSVAAQAEAEDIEVETSSKEYKKQLKAKKKERKAKEAEIEELENLIEEIQQQLADMNKAASFSNFFNQDGINRLSLYIKESTMTESSFVAQEISGYNDTGRAYKMEGGAVTVSGAKVSKVEIDTETETYMIDGGSLSITGLDIDGMINFATADIRANNEKVIMSAVIKAEKEDEDGNKEEITANVSIVGEPSSASHSETSIAINIVTATVYYTTGVTEYQRQSVEWELYDYASNLLGKSAFPSYRFEVDCANFIAAKEFEAFKNRLELGERIYLQINDNQILQPIVIGAEMTYGKPDSFSLTFADQFNANTGEYQLLDLLEQSVSMGGTVDSSKLGWNSWQDTGASTAVSDYINGALDAAKQAIIASSGQEIEINGSGVHLRKRDPETNEFTPYEIWMSNNSIMFTDDAWETAKMAIGKTANGFGVIADYLIGKFMATENLTITNPAGDFIINETGITVKDMSFKIIHADDSGGEVTESFEDYMSEIQEAIKNGVISSYSQPDMPDVNTAVEGDVWFDADDNNKIYRFTRLNVEEKEQAKIDYGYTDADFKQLIGEDGSPIDFWLGWIAVSDDRLSDITEMNDDGETVVKADTVSGAANLVTQNMKFSATNTEFNGEGMWMVSFDTGVPTGVVWLNGSGIAISQTRANNTPPDTSPYSSAYWNWSDGTSTTVLDSTGVAANKFIGNSIMGSIELGIGNPSVAGEDSTRPFYVDANGKLHATGAEINGIVDAEGFKINGSNALVGDKISADFLELRGLAIPNAQNPSFMIDSTGKVTINGGSISFNSLNTSTQDKINDAYDTANEALDAVGNLDIPTLPGYIKSTYIDSTRIEAPEIEGGIITGAQINVTGDNRGNTPILAVFDERVQGDRLRGQIYFDKNGRGTTEESSNRMFINAVNCSLKLEADEDISIGGAGWSGTTWIKNAKFFGTLPTVDATFG